MIEVGYAQSMAHYNEWQNRNLYGVANQLSDADRQMERRAFFGSIHKTLSHLLWADRLWMSRFNDAPRPRGSIPESATIYSDWNELARQRQDLDAVIIRWADNLDPDWLRGEHQYFSQSARRDITGPRWLFVTHFFNHQTHHRGQVHCMLTQPGGKPEDTDLPIMTGN
jgi:uncharacterized damage-inducible protein DinB